MPVQSRGPKTVLPHHTIASGKRHLWESDGKDQILGKTDLLFKLIGFFFTADWGVNINVARFHFLTGSVKWHGMWLSSLKLSNKHRRPTFSFRVFSAPLKGPPSWCACCCWHWDNLCRWLYWLYSYGIRNSTYSVWSLYSCEYSAHYSFYIIPLGLFHRSPIVSTYRSIVPGFGRA